MVDVNFTTSEAWASSLSTFASYLNYVGALAEITVVLFLGLQTFRKESSLRSGYYIIYLVGLIVDFVAAVTWFINNICLQYTDVFFFDADNLTFWYTVLFVGCWNTVLALNRCTALIFPVTQNSLWSQRNIKIIILLILAYPFVINGYTFSNLKCKLNSWTSDCTDVLIASRNFSAIANIIQAAISLVLGTITYIKMPALNNVSKIEYRMMSHSVYSSVLLTMYAISQVVEVIAHSTEDLRMWFSFIKAVSDIIYAFYHYSSLVFLFFVSYTFRQKYLEFYCLDRVFCKKQPAGSLFSRTEQDRKGAMGSSNSKVKELEVDPSTADEISISPLIPDDTKEEVWKILARDRLAQMYLLFEGSQWHNFSPETDSNLIRTKICYALYGMPETISENLEDWYTEEQRKPAELIKTKILEAADNPKTVLLIGFIHVVCKDKGDPFMVPVFRVFTGQNSELKDLSKYVDTNGRIYKDWESWKKNNRLPQVEYCYPKNGFYSCDEIDYDFNIEKPPVLEFGKSPACNITSRAAGVTDVVSGMTSLASGAVIAVSLFTPVAPVVLAGTAIAGGVSAVYGTLRSANRLYDKGSHSESLKDLESITSWITIVATPLNFVTAATNGILVAGAESGKIFSDMQRMGVTALMWTTIGANSAMIVTGFANLYEKKSKGQLNGLDVAQFCMSVFFFTNTLIQPSTAEGVIKSAQEQHIESYGNSMSDNAASSLTDFINKNRGENNILENSKIIRTLNKMEDPGMFFGSFAGEDMVIGGRKGNTVLVTDANGQVQRINPNQFVEASKNGNTSEFSSFKLNLNSVNEEELCKREIDARKVSNFEALTSGKGKFQSVMNTISQYDRRVVDIAMLMVEKLGIKSSESFLTLIKIIMSYKSGDLPNMAMRQLNTMNGKVLEDFIMGMKADYERACKIATEAALKFSDPWKAVYFYRKYGEDFVKRIPSDVRFYLGEAAKNLYKNEELVPIDPVYGFQNVYIFHRNECFGIVFITSRGNPIVTTFKNENLLKFYIDQIHRGRTYNTTRNLSTSAAFNNLVVETGLGAILIKFDYGNRLAESLDEFEDNEPDPEIQDLASEMLGAMILDE